MSYAMLEQQLRRLPESNLEEIPRYVDYLIYKQTSAKPSNRNLQRFYGCLDSIPDGLELQRAMRNEWEWLSC